MRSPKTSRLRTEPRRRRRSPPGPPLGHWRERAGCPSAWRSRLLPPPVSTSSTPWCTAGTWPGPRDRHGPSILRWRPRPSSSAGRRSPTTSASAEPSVRSCPSRTTPRRTTGSLASWAASPELFVEAVLRAISDPRRREIIRLVRRRELSAGEIAARFEVSRPAISQHITILREAGLLTERRDGNRRLYSARPEALAGVRSFVDEFWMDHLDRLKEAAEQEETDARN